MRPIVRAAITLVVLSAVLAGCGRIRLFERREEWRSDLESQCWRAGLVKTNPWLQAGGKIDGGGACGMDRAFKATALLNGTIAQERELTLNCPALATLERWLAEVVQPAAEKHFGQRIVSMRAGSYSCRGANGNPNANLSEHSYGNAADVFGFGLADGRGITVARGWKGDPVEQEFLREIFVAACGRFSTVLGPGADAFHYDHLHLDLRPHGRDGRQTVCRPVIKF